MAMFCRVGHAHVDEGMPPYQETTGKAGGFRAVAFQQASATLMILAHVGPLSQSHAQQSGSKRKHQLCARSVELTFGAVEGVATGRRLPAR